MIRLVCPYLNGVVELTDERQWHIARHHPELWPRHRDGLVQTLAEPEQVRRDLRFPLTRLFSRWFPHVLKDKNIVVAVVSDPTGVAGDPPRHWIVTAYPAREITQGAIEWTMA